jgi:hypothetical protein
MLLPHVANAALRSDLLLAYTCVYRPTAESNLVQTEAACCNTAICAKPNICRSLPLSNLI